MAYDKESKDQSYDPDQYFVGDRDERPWGRWEVTAVKEDMTEQQVEKRITVIPGGVLSLQSHKHRREKWTVLEGAIQVTLEENVIDLKKGESIKIPKEAKHRMANPHDTDAVVHEVQYGICMEDDITRYEDQYGRV